MSIKEDYKVYYNQDIIDEEIKDFVKEWHYSKSTRSQQQKHVFKLVDNYDNLVGVIIYGNPMSRHHNASTTIELRRLCLIDDTPKNTESFFIGKTIRWIKKNTSYEKIVSFADPNRGHSGTVYKATNFLYDGLESNGNPRVIQHGDKQYHMRQFYQKKGDEYSKDAKRLQAAVQNGEAEIIKQERKHRYLFTL